MLFRSNKDFVFMSDLRSALSKNGFACSSYVKRDGVLGVKEEGNCKFNKKDITIDLFQDAKTAKTVFDSIKSLLPGYALGTNNNWLVIVDDETIAKLLISGMKLRVYS